MEKSKVFFENDSACVFYDEKLDALFLQYKSKVKTMDGFIEVNKSVVDAFKQLSTSNLIADIRKMGIISLDAQNWLLNNLFPPIVDHLKGKKLYHAQLLDPSEIMSKVAAANLRKKTQAQGFIIEQFGDEQSMIQKLQSLKKSAA